MEILWIQGDEGADLKTLRRAAVVGAGALLIALGSQGIAQAQGPCEPTDRTLFPGQDFTVFGTAEDGGGTPLPLTNVAVKLNGDVIGQGTTDPDGDFVIAVSVPPFTNPGLYDVIVVDDGTVGTVADCGVVQVLEEEEPAPPPDEDGDEDEDADDETLEEILEAIEDLEAPAAVPAVQQQQQQGGFIPAALPAVSSGGGGGAKLPKTGADVADIGGLGTASLLVGVVLTQLARRRRRHWPAPIIASQPAATTEPMPLPTNPGWSEGDLLMPFRAVPAVPRQESVDYNTPSF